MQAFRSSRLFRASAQQVFPLEAFPICPCKDIPDPAFYILRFFLAEPDRDVSVFYIQPENRTCVVLLTAQDKSPPCVLVVGTLLPLSCADAACPQLIA